MHCWDLDSVCEFIPPSFVSCCVWGLETSDDPSRNQTYYVIGLSKSKAFQRLSLFSSISILSGWVACFVTSELPCCDSRSLKGSVSCLIHLSSLPPSARSDVAKLEACVLLQRCRVVGRSSQLPFDLLLEGKDMT